MSIVTDLSVNKKWEARKGDDNNFTITFVDTSAAAFDLTGYVFSLQIYVYSNKSTPQLALTEGSGITNGDDSGIVTFKVTDVQSDALRADSYFYQIKAVFPDANTHILFQGEFELVEFQSNNSVSSGVTATLNLNGSNVTATITVAGGGGTTTASNGLTKTGDDIALGGTLTGTTAINLDGNSFSINNGLNINFSVQNLGSFNMIGSTGSVNFQDIRSTKRGIEYGASGYVTQPLSLATKEYVDGFQPLDTVLTNTTASFTTALSSNITTNNAKVSNATHTGDVTGSEALTIAAGAVDIPMLSATGTASSSTFLRGDNTWAAVSSGGIDAVVDDTTPQLGGGLDADGNNIFGLNSLYWGLVATGNSNIGESLGAIRLQSSTGEPVEFSGNGTDTILRLSASGVSATIGVTNLTGFNRAFELPDTSGTIALTSDIVDDHTALSNIGSNTHAQIDTHISNEDLHSYMIPIWAEENGTLTDGLYQWSFGNGATTPSNNGIAIYVPSTHTCAIVAMSASTNNASGNSVIEADINGTLQGALCNVTLSGRSGTNDSFTPVSLSSGDRLTFRTTTAGTTGNPNTVTAWLKYTPI